LSTAVVMAVAEWVVTGEAAWVADGGTSERVAVRAVAKMVARIVLVEGRTVAMVAASRAVSARAAVARAAARAVVVAAVVLAAEVERAGVEGAVGQERASVATSDG